MKKPIPCLFCLFVFLTFASTPAAPAAETLRFAFSGEIVQKRAIFSVFAGNVGTRFTGCFAYDLFAADQDATEFMGVYPLLEFSVDGHDLNVPVGETMPFVPMILIMSGSEPPPSGGGPGLPSTFEVCGFHVPATANPSDNGSTGLSLMDLTSQALPDAQLPRQLDLAAFQETGLGGPFFGGGELSRDQGLITELYLVPEPGMGLWLGLAATLLLTGRRGPQRGAPQEAQDNANGERA